MAYAFLFSFFSPALIILILRALLAKHDHRAACKDKNYTIKKKAGTDL